MKKRILCLFLCGLMLANMSACTSKNTDSKKPDTGTGSASANVSDSTDNSEADSESKEPEAPIITSASLHTELNRDAAILIKKSDWDTVAFRLGNEKFSLPFSYARIMKDWTFNPADYGYEDDTFKLGASERTTNTIELKHDGMNCTLKIGLKNPSDAEILPSLASVWAINVSIRNATTYPSLLLPGGLHWGSSLTDVVLAYGTPAIPVVHNEEEHYWLYQFRKDYETYYSLIIDEKEGLIEFSYAKY